MFKFLKASVNLEAMLRQDLNFLKPTMGEQFASFKMPKHLPSFHQIVSIFYSWLPWAVFNMFLWANPGLFIYFRHFQHT